MTDIMNPQAAQAIDEAPDEPRRLVSAMAFIDRWGVLFLVLLMGALSPAAQDRGSRVATRPAQILRAHKP